MDPVERDQIVRGHDPPQARRTGQALQHGPHLSPAVATRSASLKWIKKMEIIFSLLSLEV